MFLHIRRRGLAGRGGGSGRQGWRRRGRGRPPAQWDMLFAAGVATVAALKLGRSGPGCTTNAGICPRVPYYAM